VVEKLVDRSILNIYYNRMKVNTIKLESPLLDDILAAKPREKSLSAFVREILKNDLRQRKMKEAAEAYSQFLESDAEEAKLLEEWERVDLATPPKYKRS